jgi:hypothetical protein
MIPYARLRPGSGFRPLRALLYYSQRLVTRPSARATVARILATYLNLRHRHRHRCCTPPAEHKTLTQHGLAGLPPLIAPPQIAKLRAWLGRHDHLRKGPDYPLEIVLRCPYVQAVAGHPHVLSIAAAYLHARPMIAAIGIRWTQPGAHGGVKEFHRAPDGGRFLKLFICLTDVESESGPHVFVIGSHLKRGRWRARPYTPAEIERDYGAKAVRAIRGSAGTGILADTYGIHRGEFPLRSPRLMLQVQYALLPNYALDYSPVPLQDFFGDPYLWQLLVKEQPRAAPCRIGFS